MSGAVASSSRVPSSPVVASSSRVSRSSLPQPETCASVDALQEIAEAIRDVQRRQEEHLRRVEDNAQRALANVGGFVELVIYWGALKGAELTLVLGAGESVRV